MDENLLMIILFIIGLCVAFLIVPACGYKLSMVVPTTVAFLLMFAVFWVGMLDCNGQTVPEYQAGYNDYPDDSTYNKIISLDRIDYELVRYIDGWEQAEEDHIKSEIEKSKLSTPHNDFKKAIEIERCNESCIPDETYEVTFYLLNSMSETVLTRRTCLAYGEKYKISFGDYSGMICICQDEYYLLNYQ